MAETDEKGSKRQSPISSPPKIARSPESRSSKSIGSVGSALSTPTGKPSSSWGACLNSSSYSDSGNGQSLNFRLSPSLEEDFKNNLQSLPDSFVNMVQSQFVRYGDSIKLFTKSRCVKDNSYGPKSGFALGSSTDGGYLGVYEKPDKTTRVAVPPMGDCPGVFSESVFVIRDPDNSEANIGKEVKYGDVVVLVDALGMVWNNKIGGFFDGYLGPKPRSTPGEVFVSFEKNGKSGRKLFYGDPGVYIDVRESHRHRSGYNNRLTNYKTSTSKFKGGYVSSDGSGEVLSFSVHPKTGTPSAAYDQGSFTYGNRAKMLRRMSSRSLRSGIPDIRCVKVIRPRLGGKTFSDVNIVDPAYNKAFTIYNLGSEDKLLVVLYDNSEATVEANNILQRVKHVSDDNSNENYLVSSLTSGTSNNVHLGNAKDKKVKNENGLSSLQISFEESAAATSGMKKVKEKRAKDTEEKENADIWDVLFSFDKLGIVYVALAVILPYVLSVCAAFLDSNKTGILNTFSAAFINSGLEVLLDSFISRFSFIEEGGQSIIVPSRVADTTTTKSVLWAVFLCWVFGLVTPRFVRLVIESKSKEEGQSQNGKNLKLTISAPISCFNLGDDDGDENTLGEGEENQEADAEEPVVSLWRREGTDDNGVPRHPAFQRFLIGENNNMDIAKKRWETTCGWRESKRVDEMLNQPHPNFDVIKKFYPSTLLGRSKKGYPVYIERVGEINMKALQTAQISIEDLLWHYVYTNEYVWEKIEPREGHPSSKFLTILDLKGVSLRDFVGDAIAFLKNAVSISQDHYPERGAKIFIINVPSFFNFTFRLIKPFMAEATLEKMVIKGKNYTEALLEDIDIEVLPDRYGGTAGAGQDFPWEQDLRYMAYKRLLEAGGEMIGEDGHPDPSSRERLKRVVAQYEKEKVRGSVDEGATDNTDTPQTS